MRFVTVFCALRSGKEGMGTEKLYQILVSFYGFFLFRLFGHFFLPASTFCPKRIGSRDMSMIHKILSELFFRALKIERLEGNPVNGCS